MISREALEDFLGSAELLGPTGRTTRPSNGPGFNMERYIDKYRFDVVLCKVWASHPGGVVYELRVCPFCSKKGSALTHAADGTPGFCCKHNSCSGKNIKDVWLLHPPEGHTPHMADEPVNPDTVHRTTGKPVEVLNGYDIYKTDYPPPQFLFSELLAVGLTILAGRPKCGKSWLTLQMAINAALGLPFLDRFSASGVVKVLYCGLEESPGRTHNRLRKLLRANDIQLQNIDFVYKLKALADGGAAELEAYLRKGNYGMVVIDTFLKIAKGGGNGNQNVMRAEYAEVTQLQELAHKYKLVMILVSHTRKMAAENSIDTVAGTTGITAGCDAIWTLRKSQTGESILDITGREMEEQTLGLKLETVGEFGWQLTGEGSDVGMSDARQEIVELLKDDAPLSPAQIAMRLRKNAVTTRRLLQKLAATDVVRKDRSGKYYLTSHREESTHTMNAVNGMNTVNDVNGVNDLIG
jgi:hypothetical protein